MHRLEELDCTWLAGGMSWSSAGGDTRDSDALLGGVSPAPPRLPELTGSPRYPGRDSPGEIELGLLPLSPRDLSFDVILPPVTPGIALPALSLLPAAPPPVTPKLPSGFLTGAGTPTGIFPLF